MTIEDRADSAGSAMNTAAATGQVTGYQRTFYGRADQVSQVRAGIAAYLGDCPVADDIVLVASELAANSVVHSASGGEFFTVRCEQRTGYVWTEVEDLGGPWQDKPPDDRPHGLDIIGALAGPGNWGAETASDGNRIVWARLNLPHRATPAPGHHRRIAQLAPGELDTYGNQLARCLKALGTNAPIRARIQRELSAVQTEQAARARPSQPGRLPDVRGLTAEELDRTRRELQASLALARPGSPIREPVLTHLAAIETELSSRAARQPGQQPAAPGA